MKAEGERGDQVSGSSGNWGSDQVTKRLYEERKGEEEVRGGGWKEGQGRKEEEGEKGEDEGKEGEVKRLRRRRGAMLATWCCGTSRRQG